MIETTGVYRCTILNAEVRRGRVPSPDAKQKKTICLRPNDWQYLAQWQTEEEKETGNFSPALERVMSFAKMFAPKGPNVGKERNAKGQFVGGNGSSKTANQRRKKRLIE